jgi:pimeloyl-ACP methyl ester carboxylesterase
VPGVPQLNLGPKFKCGYLTVPENRYKPRGRKIRIAVAIAEAATRHPHPDPILWLEGGPGGTGLAVAVAVVKLGINADRRIIFIDQRGTLHADPLLRSTTGWPTPVASSQIGGVRRSWGLARVCTFSTIAERR